MTPLMRYRATLTQYLIEQRRLHPEATGEFNDLILAVAQACKAISRAVAQGTLSGVAGRLDSVNVHGEEQKQLDLIANETFVHATEWEGVLSGFASEEMEHPLAISPEFPRGKYLLVFDPLDGSSNVEMNVAVGSIFSVLRAPTPGADPVESDFLQRGARAGRCGLRHLRPGHDARADGGQRRRRLHARSGAGRVLPDPPRHPHPRDHLRVRDQHVEQPLLGEAGQALRRGVPRWTDGSARQGLQHALDRLARRRGAPRPDARRRVPLPARLAKTPPSPVASACSTSATPSA